jgi:diguanylate cyclase (GGDEF)-like protein
MQVQTAHDAPPSPVDDAQRDRVALRLFELALRNQLGSITITLAGAVGLALITMDGGSWVWWWLGAMFVINGVRAAGHLLWSRRALTESTADPAARRRWQRIYEVGLLVTGVGWGSLGWYWLPRLDGTDQLVVLIVLCAGTATSTVTLAPLHRATQIYIVLLGIPACVQLLIMDDPIPVLAVLGLVFLVVMLLGHRNHRDVLKRSFTLQEDNATLVDELREQNERVRRLNAGLERRVSERTEDLRRLATHDTLTGLYNRRGLLGALERHLDQDGVQQDTTVLFLDLDRFKQINDARGHDVGDSVLAEVARRLHGALPPDAAIGRWGGDEFIVVLGGPRSASRCTAVAHALVRCLFAPIEVAGEPLHVGVSVGLAARSTVGASAMELIRAADLAAAEVKRVGRGQVLAYDAAMSDVQKRRLELGLGLKDAIADHGLTVAYQPIVDTRSGNITSLEALLRWTHPTLGSVSPNEFVAIAEESDRIVELGAWVLHRSCRDAAAWTGDSPPRVAVNASMRQLLSPDFARIVSDALRTAGLPADRLEIEVTESVFDPDDSDDARTTLNALRTLGVRINVDDFGTGYSSLSRLHEYPIDGIKVDRSFIANLDGAGRTIVQGALAMAQSFGLQVIAEGVETAEQARALTELGIDHLQGFWLGRPDFTPRLLPVLPTWSTDRAITSG